MGTFDTGQALKLLLNLLKILSHEQPFFHHDQTCLEKPESKHILHFFLVNATFSRSRSSSDDNGCTSLAKRHGYILKGKTLRMNKPPTRLKTTFNASKRPSSSNRVWATHGSQKRIILVVKHAKVTMDSSSCRVRITMYEVNGIQIVLPFENKSHSVQSW